MKILKGGEKQKHKKLIHTKYKANNNGREAGALMLLFALS
jgi:hypothetical protein